jgi:hypothetical protein
VAFIDEPAGCLVDAGSDQPKTKRRRANKVEARISSASGSYLDCVKL